ncbi:MAG: hypothetical protein JRG91_17300, partial [Deltaproteobacteria bacterium]|nr:hypothetical protein [Deltaproteobacteria bacterium]
MTPRTVLLAAFSLVAGVPQAVHAQGTLSAEDVTQSLQDAQFQEALGGCFKKADRPDEITLVLLVKAQGETHLVDLEDDLPPITTSCVSKAVAHLTMPATGNHFQITVSVPVPETSSTITIKQV